MTLSTPLTAPQAFLGQVAMRGKMRSWSWDNIFRASIELSERLGKTAAVCNLCESHVGFVITLLATTRCGHLQLFPPSRGNIELIASFGSHDNTLIVVDNEKILRPEWRGHVPCLVVQPEALLENDHDTTAAWTPDWDAPLFKLFTSGSTGVPQPRTKTLRQLTHGALALRQRINQEFNGELHRLQYIVSSVAPQHMFGFETSVMLLLTCGIPVLDTRPLLPADVQVIIDKNQSPSRAVWIATPLHLQALSRAGITLNHCELIVTSTMALDKVLARQVENLTNSRVLEIYGSTETGALATRRTAFERWWHPLQGVRISPTPLGAKASGRHFESPQVLNDRIEFIAEGYFNLLGRNTDLIKIAGRRASLAGLNFILRDLPGVSDSTFYLPSSNNVSERLVLIYEKTDTPITIIKSYLRTRIDSVFMPRAFIQIEKLPRLQEGKLSIRDLEIIYLEWMGNRA